MSLFFKKEKTVSELINGVWATERVKTFEQMWMQDVNEKQLLAPQLNNGLSIDAQIHSAVYSAQERILSEAIEILNQPVKYNSKKRETLLKLRDLGFGSAQEVNEFTLHERAIEGKVALVSKIEEYKRHYPLNKFIDAESVKAICKKYELYLTEVGSYIAEIPEKNQEEIVNFSFYENDYRDANELDQFSNWMSTSRTTYRPSTVNMFRSYMNDLQYGTSGQPSETRKPLKKCAGKSLLIIAPEHKLNVAGKTKHGHIFKDDPIVLQPVKEGYLIVTSWGLEASDPLVVNEINQ